MTKSFNLYARVGQLQLHVEWLEAHGYATSVKSNEEIATITVSKFGGELFTAEESAQIGMAIGKLLYTTASN